MLKMYEEAAARVHDRAETYYATFVLGKERELSYQTRGLKTAEMMVEAMDAYLKAQGWLKVNFTRRRKPSTHVTTYVYHYGRRD